MVLARAVLPAAAAPAWHRWCLPWATAKPCQDLKGALGDGDNSFCDSLLRRYRDRRDRSPLCPWEHPTAITFADSYGF